MMIVEHAGELLAFLNKEARAAVAQLFVTGGQAKAYYANLIKCVHCSGLLEFQKFSTSQGCHNILIISLSLQMLCVIPIYS